MWRDGHGNSESSLASMGAIMTAISYDLNEQRANQLYHFGLYDEIHQF
jgi:hypothetical protein